MDVSGEKSATVGVILAEERCKTLGFSWFFELRLGLRFDVWAGVPTVNQRICIQKCDISYLQTKIQRLLMRKKHFTYIKSIQMNFFNVLNLKEVIPCSL